MRRTLQLLLIAALALSSALAEQVTITGIAQYGGGQTGTGSITITYDQFINENGDVIGGQFNVPFGASGEISVQLWSNASSYTISYAFDDRSQRDTRYWNIPFGQGTALTISDVEVPTPTNVTKSPVEQISTEGATPGQVITAVSGDAGDASWENPGGGGAGVSSFNTRVGAVVPIAADYAAFNAPWITPQTPVVTPLATDSILLQRTDDSWVRVAWSNLPSGGTTDHSALSNLDYASAGHTGFEAAIAAGTSSLFWDGTKTFRAVAIGDVTGLQTALDSKEPTISGAAASLFWDGGKTFRQIVIADVSGLQADLDGKAIVSGTPTAGNCTRWLNATTIEDAGSPCGSGGGGEANTYSNAGLGGVGVTLTKVGVNLPFKAINGASSKISVANDALNSEVDIDLVEANVLLPNLGGLLTDVQLGNSYSGVGACTAGQYAHTLTRNAAPTCKAVDYGELSSAPTLAPVDAGYWTKTADATLTNEFPLSTLDTGILKNTTVTGVPTIAVAGVDYEAPFAAGSVNEFLSWDKTFRTIDWSYLTGTQPAPAAHAATHETGGGDLLDLPSIPGQIPTSRSDFPALNGAQQTLQQTQSIYYSAGIEAGGEISDAGGQTINVAGGTGLIRTTAAVDGELHSFSFPPATGLAIPLDQTRYVIVNYNAGNPQVELRTSQDQNNFTELILGNVSNDQGELIFASVSWLVSDNWNRVMQWLDGVMFVDRDFRDGGLNVTPNGVNLEMDTGSLWALAQKFTIPAIDTSGTGTFTRYYRDGAGGFTKVPGQTEWNTDFWDDGSGTLQSLGGGDCTANWYVLDTSGNLSEIIGDFEIDKKKCLEARDQPPPAFPPFVWNNGIPISRWVIKDGTSAPIAYENIYDPLLSTYVPSHPELTMRDEPDQHPATSVTNTPAGTISADNTQGAVDELSAEKLDKSNSSTNLSVIFGDGTGVITAGTTAKLGIPFACTVIRWDILAEEIGNLSVRVDKDTYAAYPPVVGDSICAAACPSVTGANKGQSATLTGWTTSIAEDDVISFVVTGTSTGITQATVSLKCTR